MIIVSQDKETIVNFDNLIQIYITKDEEKTSNFIRYEAVDSLYEDLGEYATEERAKEVLQEIIRMIEDTSWTNLMENLQISIHDKNFGGSLSSVYYMPKE